MKKLSAPRLDSWDRPIRPGLPVSATPNLIGTLGAVVRDRFDGTLLLLGTSHVLFPSGLSGSPIWQPTPCAQKGCDCNRVGFASRDCCDIVVCGGHRYFIDCAVARLDEDVPCDSTIAGRCVAGVGSALPGARVWKLGAASGQTSGIVIDNLHEETALVGEEYRLVPNQILVQPLPKNPHAANHQFSTIGDSGAVMLDEEDRAVGLLWGASPGGYALACPIGPVLETLAIDLEICV